MRYKEIYAKIKQKLRSGRGASIAEMLAAVMIMLLASSVLVRTVNLAMSQYADALRHSHAVMLASTLRCVISDELTYGKGQTEELMREGCVCGQHYEYERLICGSVEKQSDGTRIFAEDPDGAYGYLWAQYALDPGKQELLVSKRCYTDSLLARIDELTYDGSSNVFHVKISLSYDGINPCYESEFDVINAN